MKKALSIFLFLCFVLYHFGYYAFYFSYDHHLESEWQEIIYSENSIDAHQMLIEIPLSAPYMANQEEFQPTNTSFEKDGKFFRAIKQRYQNDTLQIVVVPDTARAVLNSTVKKWVSYLTEDAIPQDQNGKTVIKHIVKDYLQPGKNTIKLTPSISYLNSPEFIFSNYSNPFFQLVSPPPQAG